MEADLFGNQPVGVPVGKTRRKPGESAIVRMRGKFGCGPESATCGGCDHLVQVGHGRRDYFKCELYSLSRSETSDFRKKWLACGRFIVSAPSPGRGGSA